MRVPRYRPLPVASRYVVGQFLGIFIPVLASFILLYIIVDFFDRLDILLRHDATASSAARYFLFKIPLMVTQVTPAAVVTAVLLSLGLLSRYNEIVAFRAGGVSLGQTAIPLIAMASFISVATLAWNETVVPYCTHQFQLINNLEIRKRELRGILSEREIWYHGAEGFYHIDHVNRTERIVYGLIIYRLDEDFMLRSVIEIPKAQWLGDHWLIPHAVERELTADPPTVRALTTDQIALPESLEDFIEVQREPEELSFVVLRDWIRELGNKGIDATEYLVDLHLKLAVPFASTVLAMVAIPISGRVRRHPSMAAIIGLGLAVGSAYWVTFGMASSIGRNSIVPPVVAAWAANVIFGVAGAVLFLQSD
jgi:lipopolysaccharide export system permease protein